MVDNDANFVDIGDKVGIMFLWLNWAAIALDNRLSLIRHIPIIWNRAYHR